MTHRSAMMMSAVLLAVFSAISAASAQESSDSFKEDLRSQPFVTGSIGTFPSGAAGGTTFGFGAGMDYLVADGFALGGDIAVFGGGAWAFSVLSFSPSYHLIRGSSRFIPFVKAGIGTGGVLEYGSGSVTFANFGGGMNLWKLEGSALRIEVVDRFPIGGGDHHINVQFGLTF